MTNSSFLNRTGKHESGRFQQALRSAAALSTVGISTLSGVSPKSAALERLAWTIAKLPDAAQQIDAYRDILRESGTLWPDQHAHVIATLILDLQQHRVQLAGGALQKVADLLLAEAVAVAPELKSDRMVNDSLAFDVLKSYVNALVRNQSFKFAPETAARLRAAGLDQPPVASIVKPEDGPVHEAMLIREEIAMRMVEQIDAGHLAPLLARIAALPDMLRGRMLALTVNGLWNILRDPRNLPIVARIRDLIAALPSETRITSIEAYYNQINFLPPAHAKEHQPLVAALVDALDEAGDPRYCRSRADLLAGLQRQTALLSNADFLPEETLAKYEARLGRMDRTGQA